MYSPELQSKLAIFRQKVADGTITPDELKEAADLLRQERKTAVIAAGKRASKSKAPGKSADALLAELDAL